MGHTCATYTVRVRGIRSKDYRKFGNFDKGGGYLLDQLEDCLRGLTASSADDTRDVQCTSVTATEPELKVLATHGLRGVGMDVIRHETDEQLRIHPPDTQRVRCGALFSLSRDDSLGFLAVHINSGRSVKGLMVNELTDRFRSGFDDLILEIHPSANRGVLEDALERGALDKIHLVRYERPSDRANAATNKWVEEDLPGRLELIINPRGRGRHLRANLIRRYLSGDNREQAFHEIISFDRMLFEEAKVEVILRDGRRKLVNISAPDSGNVIVEELEGLELIDGDPTDESLFKSLRLALADVAPRD